MIKRVQEMDEEKKGLILLTIQKDNIPLLSIFFRVVGNGFLENNFTEH